MRLSLWGFIILSIACDSDKGVTVFNTDPEAEITSHEDGDRLLIGEEVQFIASLNDDNHGPESLKAIWYNSEGILS